MVSNVLTSIEATGNGGGDDLESEECTHSQEDCAVFLVDSMDANDMDG